MRLLRNQESVKFEQIRARHNLATMSNNNDDTTTPIPRFRAAQVHRTVVHPNLSASSLQKLRNKQHTRRPSIGQDGTTEPFVVDRNEREYSEDVPCNIQYQKNTSTLLLLDL